MFKAFFKIFFGSLAGKSIGIVRELILAFFYGTTNVISAFRISHTATLIPINFFTSDTLNAGFIPMFNKLKQEDIKKAYSFFWIIKIILLILSIILMVIIYYYSFSIINFIAPGFDKETKEISIKFLQIMSVGVPFYIISNLYAFLAMSYDIYFLVSIRPILQSLGIIISAIFAICFHNIYILALSFSGVYIIFFFISLFILINNNLLKFHFKNISILSYKFWKIIKPLLPLPFLLQCNILVEKIIASFLGVEVVASLEYSKFIIETGLVLLAVPLGLVGLSKFVNLDENELKRQLLKIVNVLLFITIPISFYILLFSYDIIEIIFKRGMFDENSVYLTSNILTGFSFGFWANVIGYVLIKALNAKHKNKIVLKFMFFAILVNSVFNLLFYKMIGVYILGLSSSLYGVLLFLFTIKFFKLNIYKLLLNLIVGGVFIFLIIKLININFIVNSILYIFIWGVYFILNPKLNKQLNIIKDVLWKKKI